MHQGYRSDPPSSSPLAKRAPQLLIIAPAISINSIQRHGFEFRGYTKFRAPGNGGKGVVGEGRGGGGRFYDPRHPGLNSVVNVNPRDCRDETMIDVDLSTSHVRSFERWKEG